MIRKNTKFPKQIISEINVVPYIDVMLVLLVIFMVTAPLLQQGVSVDLPQASADAIPPADLEPIVLSVDRQGQYFLNISDHPNDPIDLEQLQLRIAADLSRHPARKVLVKGDQRVNYGEVIGAMVALQLSGVKGVGLITQDPTSYQASHKTGARGKG